MKARDSRIGCYISVPARTITIEGDSACVSPDIDTTVPLVIASFNQQELEPHVDVDTFLRQSLGADAEFTGFLVRPSTFHGRSWETPDTEPFYDEFGNPYTALGYKGGDCSSGNWLVRSPTAQTGYVPFGKLDGDAMARVQFGSKVLRSIGVDTEWNQAFVQPESFAVSGQLVDKDAFKAHIIKETDAAYRGKITGKAEEFEPDDLVVMKRASLTPHRIADFATDTTVEALRLRLGDVFDAYNAFVGPRTEHADLPEVLHVDRADIDLYFTTVLPTLLAGNVARMHDQYMWHKYLTSANSYALGGIADLDSLRGPALGFGDRRPSPVQVNRDLSFQMYDPNLSPKEIVTQTIAPVFANLTSLGIYEDPLEGFESMSRYQTTFEGAYLMARKNPDMRVSLDLVDENFDLPAPVFQKVLETLVRGQVEFRVNEVGSTTMWVVTEQEVYQVGPEMEVGVVYKTAQPGEYIPSPGAWCYEIYSDENFTLPSKVTRRLDQNRREFANNLATTVYCNFLQAHYEASGLAYAI